MFHYGALEQGWVLVEVPEHALLSISYQVSDAQSPGPSSQADSLHKRRQ